MSIDQAKTDIRSLTTHAYTLIPATLPPNLPEIEGIAGVPDWHDYERQVWALGEQIRQHLLQHKSLRKDKELLDMFLKVCLNRNAKRGRQSFIMLFEYKHWQEYASQIITQIDDEFVCLHVISALNKMKAKGYSSIIEIFTTHKVTVIRNEAKKYMANLN